MTLCIPLTNKQFATVLTAYAPTLTSGPILSAAWCCSGRFGALKMRFSLVISTQELAPSTTYGRESSVAMLSVVATKLGWCFLACVHSLEWPLQIQYFSCVISIRQLGCIPDLSMHWHLSLIYGICAGPWAEQMAGPTTALFVLSCSYEWDLQYASEEQNNVSVMRGLRDLAKRTEPQCSLAEQLQTPAGVDMER